MGNGILDLIKKTFGDIPLKKAVIDIPYFLYNELRRKVYGNTYIFPYIAKSDTVINKASNKAEWGDEGNSSFM